jgi:hypothetical protein
MTISVLNSPGQHRGPYELISSAQDLTANWVALGDKINLTGVNLLALYAKLDINGSTNARARLRAATTAGGDLHTLTIETKGASSIAMEPQFKEFNTDANQNAVISWRLDGTVLFGQIEVQVGTVGAPAGQIDAAEIITVVGAL